MRHVTGTADVQSLGNPVARHRGFVPELVCKGDVVQMSLWVTIQVRFRPSHFLQALLDDLAGTLRVRLAPLTSQFMWLAATPSFSVRR